MPQTTFRPLNSRTWNDFQQLFGPRGACGGCWCMWWRQSQSQFNAGKGSGNRKAMKKLVETSVVPGILAYEGKRPVGWCSVGPREQFSRLQRSRVLARVDDQPVWSIVCFFVTKDRRRSGITRKLIQESVRHARRNGARIVEGYPVEPAAGGIPDAFAYPGLASAFRKAGFREAARRSPRRAVFRRSVARRGSGKR